MKPDFLITPYQLIADKDIQPSDERVFSVIYWFEHLRDGICKAGNDTIAEMSKISTKAVSNSLNKLEEKGYIKREYKDENRRNRLSIRTRIAFRFLDEERPERGSKQKKVKEIKTIIPDWIDKNVWAEWEQHRKEIKKKLTPTTAKRQIEMLSNNRKDYIEIIKNSIQNGWTGLFPLKDKKEKKFKNKIGILRDGTKVEFRFGKWVDINNIYIKLDESYYPELANDCVILEDDWKKGKRYDK